MAERFKHLNPKVSIVTTTYNRAALLQNTLRSIFSQQFKDFEVIVVDDGNDEDTPLLCEHYPYPVRYFKRVREPGTFYSNPSVPNNIGIQKALGDLIILQNSECAHHSPEVIKAFLDQTKEGTAVFGQVSALTENGVHQMYYTHHIMNPRPFFFCGALHRDVFMKLRGFDENFKYYGYDDDSFALRAAKYGIEFKFSDTILIDHQYHGPSFKPEDAARNIRNQIYFQNWKRRFDAGEETVEVNIGRDWGVLG